MTPQTYPWSDFRSTMATIASRNEGRYSKLYQLVEEYDGFVCTVLRRPHGINSTRPQDYLVCVLLARSFRLMMGGVALAAFGYSDLSPNLRRTNWEIGVRLLCAQKDPVAAAFGFLIHADGRELELIEAELAHRDSSGEEVGCLRESAKQVRDHQSLLESLARGKGVEVAEAVRVFGRLNVRQACRELGIEKAYSVDFAFDSGHVHERNLTTGSFLTVSDSEAKYELGPMEQVDTGATTFDALRGFGLVAIAAALLLEDDEAIVLAQKIGGRLDSAWEATERGV